MLRGLPLVLLVLVCARGTAADEIVLRDGDSLIGSLFGTGEERRFNPYGSTAQAMTFGVQTIRARDVLEVLPDPTRSGFFRRYDELKPGDVQGRVASLRLAQRGRLRAEICRAAAEILALSPGHAEAKKALKGPDLARTPRLDRLPHLRPEFQRGLTRLTRIEVSGERARFAAEMSRRHEVELTAAYVERMARSADLPRGLQEQRALRYKAAAYPQARYDLFVPLDYDPTRPHPLCIAFHGGGILGTQKDGPVLGTGRDATALFLASAEQAGWILVSPNALVAPWSERENLEMVDAVVEEVLRTWNVDVDRIHVVGHSGGAEGAYAYQQRHDDRFASVGGAAGAAPRKARAIARRGAGPWLYHGEDDEILPVGPVRKEAVKLLKAKADFRYCELPREGHGLPPAAMADWLHFARPRRRAGSRSAWPRSSLDRPVDDAELAAFGDPADAWGGARIEQGTVADLVAMIRAGRFGTEPAARRLASLGAGVSEAVRQQLRDTVESREAPRAARSWAAFVLGRLADKDDGTIMVIGDALRAETDLVLLGFLADAAGRIASSDSVEDLRSALLQLRVHFVSLKGDTIPQGAYARIITLASRLVEGLGRTAKASDVQRDIEEVCVIGILRDRRRIVADPSMGESVSATKAHLVRSLGRAYRSLGVDKTVIDMLTVTARRDRVLAKAAAEGLREGLR